MRAKRALVPHPEKVVAGENPSIAIYHVVTRVVDRRFVLEDEEREHLRMLLRMYERFSGCRILSYCLMSNHIHVLLEVPPGCQKGESLGLSDEELLRRLGGLYSRNYVAGVERELLEARKLMEGNYARVEKLTQAERKQNEALGKRKFHEVHARFSYRMHSLSEFFKGMLQRFTCWYNRQNGRTGTLWESRFKSVIVQDGLAARTMAAYIDLNPVRAGMVEDPADYRWSSYGEAVGGGKGSKAAQVGLVRALQAHSRKEGSARAWSQGGVGKEYRKILMAAAVEAAQERLDASGKSQRVVTRKGMSREKAEAELVRLSEDQARDLKVSKVIRCRVRYFTDGAVIGSRTFVDEMFGKCRDVFSYSEKRKDGARKPRGALSELAGELWTLRDLQKEE